MSYHQTLSYSGYQIVRDLVFISPSFYLLYLEKAFEFHSPILERAVALAGTRYSRVNSIILRKLLDWILYFQQ